MSIARRMGTGYAAISLACVGMVIWLGYHEFVEEPREFAAMGAPHVHKDTDAELSTMCFLGAIPLLLAIGWWWMYRVLAPLKALAAAVEQVDRNNLGSINPQRGKADEIDRLADAFNAMTARLDSSFRRLDEFTLNASHELKTPLSIMRAQLETTMRETPSMPPEQIEWMESQLDEVMRLTRIVDSLTLLTKADAGLVELERIPVALDAVVSEAYEDALILAQPIRAKVVLSDCEPCQVLGDRHRLRQLLLILTDNAVKYNEPEGNLTISLKKTDGFAVLRIINSSADLKPEVFQEAFGRFVRGGNARGIVDGCGLGLTIAKWITEAHSGTISLLSEKTGETTALIRIPALI